MCTCTSSATSPAASMRFASMPFASVMKQSLVGDDDVGWAGHRVELLDERRAMAQHGALIDRSIVGDLVRVDRRRLVEHARARDAGRAAGRTGADVAEPASEDRTE